MKRCFVIAGPESSGNRLLAAILIRAGCRGDASTDQRWDSELPTDETPAVIIRSFPHGEEWPDLQAINTELEARGYAITTLITVRHHSATVRSQVSRGHATGLSEAAAQIREAYTRIFAKVSIDYMIVPYAVLIYESDKAIATMLEDLGLPPITEGDLMIDGEPAFISNQNAKHYEQNAASATSSDTEAEPGPKSG